MDAAEFVPDTHELPVLARAAGDCRGCELFEAATQTVFGAGPARATVMLVGEQPGDVEDRAGAPFVGPAGQVLDRALLAAGLDRSQTYITNAVKHFYWKSTASGKRRLHQTPMARHVTACRPWLAAELDAVRPTVVVALGATASRSLFGPSFRLTHHRGERLDWDSATVLTQWQDVTAAFATIHPSAVLRADDREGTFAGLVDDLRVVAALVT